MRLRIRLICALALAAFSSVLFAAENQWSGASLFGRTADGKGFYRVGEEIRFVVTPDLPKGMPEGEYWVKWERTGNDGVKDSGRYKLTSGDWTYKTKLAKPGFVRLEARVVDAAGKPVTKNDRGWSEQVFFDGGAGADAEKLETAKEPDDFDAFWTKRKERLAKLPLKVLERKEMPSESGKVWAVSVNCAGPRPVTGYLSIPDGGGKFPVEVTFMGYSENSVQQAPKRSATGRIVFAINAHGYELGREKEYYGEFYESIKSGGAHYAFDERQNASREQAYFGWMAYRVMRALQYAKSLPEWDGKNLKVAGGSQGGLQAAWAAGLDEDVTAADLSVVWCCDIEGSKNRPGWYVRWTPALGYFDAVNHGKRIPEKCKVRIGRAGLGDYVSPPRGLQCLYNAIRGPKSICWIQGAQHGYAPTRKDNPKYEFSSEGGEGKK